jgi:hypothetical protein
MGFAAVARVTENRWICCASRDDINFGLKAGGELEVDTTTCHEIRQSREAVVIDHVAADATFCGVSDPDEVIASWPFGPVAGQKSPTRH